jgi:hypothetical protein
VNNSVSLGRLIASPSWRHCELACTSSGFSILLRLRPASVLPSALNLVYPINAIRKLIARRLTTERIDQLITLLAPIVADTPSGVALAARFPAIWSTRTARTPA